MDGQDAHPTRNSLFVERASSPLLTLVQDLSYNKFGNGNAVSLPQNNQSFSIADVATAGLIVGKRHYRFSHGSSATLQYPAIF